MDIDISFDFRTDSGGKDPDRHSPTLREYHKFLWSKTLPDGRPFDLTIRGAYLHHRSELGEFVLSSDSVIPTFTRWGFAAAHPELVTEEENKLFMDISYTIGGMMLFPANQVDGKPTVNQARGFVRNISDRFDLTLECIRRFYEGQASPLGETLSRYRDFFDLFGNFRDYTDFFLLQDLTTDGGSAVRLFPPFDDFRPPSAPKDIETYSEYRRRAIEFIVARNERIKLYASASVISG